MSQATTFGAPKGMVLLPGDTLPREEGDAFVLQGGRAEIYALLVGRRMFLGTLGPGDWAFGAPSLLVLLPEGGNAIRHSATDLARLAADPLRRGELIARLDRWIETLAAGVARHLGDVPAPRRIAATDAFPPGPPGEPVAPERGTLWATGTGMTLFGVEAAPAGFPTTMPVPPSSWLSGSAAITLLGTAAVLRTAEWTGGLSVFHALVGHVLTLQLGQIKATKADRLRAREADIDATLAQSSVRFSTALTERSRIPPPGIADAAWALMQCTPGTSVPPGAELEAAGLEDLAERCGLHVRRITLSGAWWQGDRGRLVTRRLQDGRPVALVPDWRGRIRVLAQHERPMRVDAALAAGLDPAALEVVRPLPPGPLSIGQLVRHGLILCRHDVTVLAAATLMASVLGLILPYATGLIVNVLIPGDLRGGVLRLGAALAVVTLGNSGLGLCAALVRTRMDGRLAGILQTGVLDRTLRLPLAALRSVSSADLTLRVLSIDQLRRLVTRALLDGVLGGVFGLSSLFLLFAYSSIGGLVALVLAVLLLLLSFGTGLLQIRALTRGEAMTATLSSLTLQIIQNVVTLRAFGAERQAFIEWLRISTETRRRMLQSRLAAVRYEAGLVTFHNLALAVIFGFLALGSEENRLSLGACLAFVAAFQGFLMTSEAWGRAVMQIAAALPMFERTRLILRTAPETRQDARPPGRLEGALSFSGVAYGYSPDAPPVLNDVSLEVTPGSFVAIVGGSGSGKTTLLSLALGFANPDRGAILFDNKDLSGLDLAAVRRQIGIVRQSGQLLGGSLLENIRGMHNCSLEEAWHAAGLAGIADEIRAMPMGMHTAVIEGSAGFSGGQVQRMLLARALAGQPRLLILDEATSALDNLTQSGIVANLAKLGISRLVVAHRLSTIRGADTIHFLHEGRIAESGGYDELMRGSGLFAAFAQRQTL